MVEYKVEKKNEDVYVIRGQYIIKKGMGSSVHTVLNYILYSDIKEIYIFSRDEKKQDYMRFEL